MTLNYRIIEGVDDDLVGQMNDSISALAILLINLGGMFNIIGAAFFDFFGYEFTMIIYGCFILCLALIFLVFNAGQKVYQNF